MSIWANNYQIEDVNSRNADTLSDFLGIVISEINPDSLKATMPITAKVKQPIGIMHGGSSCVLAETVGSTAANMTVDLKHQYCVGLDINTNHIRSIRDGMVTATAKPFHLGKTTQVWEILIHDEQQRLISVTRLTMAVLNRQ